MAHGIKEAHNAAYHFSKDEFVEGRLVRQKLEKIHLYQEEFCKISQYEKIGSCIYDWKMLLQRSKGNNSCLSFKNELLNYAADSIYLIAKTM